MEISNEYYSERIDQLIKIATELQKEEGKPSYNTLSEARANVRLLLKQLDQQIKELVQLELF